MLISVVVPVYNSTVLEELTDALETSLAALVADSYEIIFVDDGSPEVATWATLERLVSARPRIRAVQLTRNFGQQAATCCGLAEAAGDWVVTLDDDLQHDPAELSRLWALRHYDIVIGQFRVAQQARYRRVLSALKGWFDRKILRLPLGVRLSSYRLLSRAVVTGILAIRTPRPFLPALMLHVTRRIIGVELTHRARAQGRSGYTAAKMGHVFSNLVINNSSLLLRLVGELGVVSACTSFAGAGWLIYRRVVHTATLPGWTSLLVVLLLIGGVILFSVGIIGEYLIRIIEINEGRQTYCIRRSAGPVRRV